MPKFALRRIAASLLILLVTTVFIYALLLAAPGGPEQKYANNPRFTPQQQQAYVKALGLISRFPSSTAAGSVPAAVTQMGLRR